MPAVSLLLFFCFGFFDNFTVVHCPCCFCFFVKGQVVTLFNIFISLVIGLYVRYYVSQNHEGNIMNRVTTKIGVTQSNSTNQSPMGELHTMSPSFCPTQSTRLFSAIEQPMATNTPYDLTQHQQPRFFDVPKNLSKLQGDQVEYGEILSKQVTMESTNAWLPAKVANINDTRCEIDAEYFVSTQGCKMNGKKETLNLTQGVDSGRFRVHSFGCPEPCKLPMDKKFGIPKLSVQLMINCWITKFVVIRRWYISCICR